jgi:hypothetical protein
MAGGGDIAVGFGILSARLINFAIWMRYFLGQKELVLPHKGRVAVPAALNAFRPAFLPSTEVHSV